MAGRELATAEVATAEAANPLAMATAEARAQTKAVEQVAEAARVAVVTARMGAKELARAAGREGSTGRNLRSPSRAGIGRSTSLAGHRHTSRQSPNPAFQCRCWCTHSLALTGQAAEEEERAAVEEATAEETEMARAVVERRWRRARRRWRLLAN